MEKELSRGATFLDCFRGANLRRTEICVVAYIIQIWGWWRLPGLLDALLRAGGSAQLQRICPEPGHQGVCFYRHCPVSLVHPSGEWAGGTLYCSGEAVLTVFLFLIGILDVVPDYSSHPGLQYSQAVMLFPVLLCVLTARSAPSNTSCWARYRPPDCEVKPLP